MPCSSVAGEMAGASSAAGVNEIRITIAAIMFSRLGMRIKQASHRLPLHCWRSRRSIGSLTRVKSSCYAVSNSRWIGSSDLIGEMKTLTHIGLIAVVLLWCGLGLLSAAEQAAAARPNIIIILSDDMGYADIGAHGCKDIPTPNIDQIARGGMRFTDAYANGSFCTPTRAALMSGRYQQRSGNEDVSGVTGPLPNAITALPQRLRSAG